MPLEDYGALLRSGQSLVPDYAAQEAQRQILALKKQELGAQLSQLKQKQDQRAAFEHDLTQVLADPSATNISGLILKHPEFADQVKSAWDVKDKAVRDADLTQMSEIYSAASAGKYDVAAKSMQARIDADKATGHTDPTDQAILDALNSNDPVQQKGALGMIGVHLAGATGAEHFGTVYGALKGGYTLDAGAARFGENNEMTAHSPFIKDADGNIRLWTDPGQAAPSASGAPAATTPANVAPHVAAVASTLTSAGLPAPVVAGFVGNFHAEGGYNGAQGDGGSASGIAQWHGDRSANFQKVIGKPVAEASPEEQAQFVAWEMKNPEAAGMTVKQRDAILAAKTPAQAAALIDQYYERSSGNARQSRMAAATAFASAAPQASASAPSGQYPIIIPGKQPTKRILTPQEARAKGLPDNQTYQIDDKTGDISPISGTAEAEDGFDPQAVEFSAQQYLATGQMPTLGMGKAAARARKQIIERAAKIAGADGLTGADFAQQITHYKAATQALKTLETQAGTIEQNEKTALMNGQQFIDRSKELSAQTRFPIVNSVTQSYLRHTGDPTIAAMDAAWNTFTTEYAKVVAGSPSGAGTLSDSARHESQEIMRGNYSYQQKLSAFRQMQADMANRMAAIHQTITKKYDTLTKNPRKAAEIAAQTDLGGVSASKSEAKTIVRTGRDKSGKRVVQYSDGTVSYAP